MRTGSAIGGWMQLAAALAVTAPGGPALAQSGPSASSDAPGDIIVTARRREETALDVPLTVNAFTGEQLARRDIRDVADLSRFAPGITFVPGNSRLSSTISVRGITQVSAVGDNRRDLVSVFIDGVPYVGNPSGVGLEDLERAEVIKGPQSALFGRATFGGAISLITRTPGDALTAELSGTFADYGDRRLSARAEIPIIGDKLAIGLAGELTDFDGFYANPLGGRLGESKGEFGSATLVARPAPQLTIKARAQVRHDRDGPAASVLIGRWFDHNCGPFPGFTSRPLVGLPPSITTVGEARRAQCGALETPDPIPGINTTIPPASLSPVRRTALDEHKLELNHELYTLSGDLDVGRGHTLSGIASTQRQDLKVVQDFERAPEDRYQISAQNQQYQDFFEARLTSPGSQRFIWMVGTSYIFQRFNSFGGFILGALFGPAAGGPNPIPTLARSSQENVAVFGSFGFDITQRLNLAVELRHQEERLTSGIGQPSEVSVATKATLPRAILRYALRDQSNVYFTYAQGNQPTAPYADFFALTPEGQRVAAANGVFGVLPEARLSSYELGFKHRSPGGRWFAYVSGYYLEWSDRQGIRTVQVDINGDGVINLTGTGANREVFNAAPFAAGDSNTKGFEIETGFNATRWLTLGGAMAYADTTITKALNEALLVRFFGQQDGAGQVYGNAPRWTATFYGDVDVPLSDRWATFGRVDVNYVSRRFDSITNLAWVPDLWRVNLRAGVRFNDRIEGSIWVTNLLDDDTLESASYNSDSAADPFIFQLSASEGVLPRRRQVGVTLTVRK